MAQQNIDFGSFPNDPGADAIRTAFEKVQQNFTDLYTTTFSSGVTQVITGPGLNQTRPTGDVKITANIPNITIQTSSSLRVGVGVATGNTATISSWVTPFVIDLSSNITTANANIGNITVANLNVTNRVTSSLVPSVDVTYNLGSPTRRWKDLYLSGNTIDLGGALISSDGSAISLASLTATTTIQSPTITASTSISSPSINIGNATMTNNGGNVVMPALQIGPTLLNSSGITISGNILTANANIENMTVANLNVTNRVTSSLIPSADITYNLGSPTRRWKDLYLSGNTIDLGGSLISADGGTISVGALTAATAIEAPAMTVSSSISSPTINIGNTAITSSSGALVMPALQVGQTILNPTGLTVSGTVTTGVGASAVVIGPTGITTGVGANAITIASTGITTGVGANAITLGAGGLTSGTGANAITIGAAGLTTGTGANAITITSTGITTGTGAGTITIGAAGITVGDGITQTTITNQGVQLSASATIQAPGSDGQLTFNDGGNAAAVPGLTFNKNTNLLSIAGNVSGGNLVSTGILSLTKDANIGGNVTSANLLTGRVEATSIISSGGSNVVLDPAGTVSAIGNISGGNITTNGNVSTANLNATFIVSTGNANITGMMNTGNLTTTGTANIIGNITGGNLVTSGLANIGGLITQGTANVGLLISTGHANITGNVTAGNLISDGTLSAGNLSTNGNVSAGNVGASLITAVNSNTTGTHTTTELVVSSNANIQGTHRALIGFTTGTHTAGNFFTTGEANVGTHKAGTSVTTGLHTSNTLKVDLDAEIIGNGKLGNANVVGLLTTLSANVTGTHAAQTSVTRGLHTANTLTVNLDAEITGNGILGNANVLGLFTSVNANVTGLHKAAISETVGTHTARDLKIDFDAEITGNSTHGNANVLGTLTVLDASIRGNTSTENSIVRGTHTANTLTINLNASVSGSHTVGTTGANVVMSAGDLSMTGRHTAANANVTGIHYVGSGASNVIISSGNLTMTGRHTAANANVTGIHYVGDNTNNVSISNGNLTMTGRHTAANANVTGIHYVGDNTNNVSISSGNLTMTGRHTAANANVTGTHYVGDNTSNVSISNGNVIMTGTHTAGYIIINTDSETKRNHKTANLQVTTNANFDAGMFVTNNANVGSMKVRGDHNVDGNVTSTKVTSNIATFGATPNDPGTSLTVNGVVSVVGNASIGNITAINSVTGNVISLTGNASGTALVAAGLVRVGGNHAVTQNIAVGVSLSISAASIIGGQLFLTFAEAQSIAPFHVGQKVVLAGFSSNPLGTNYNIEYTVSALTGATGNWTGGLYLGMRVPTSFSTPINVYGTVTTAGNALTVSGNLLGASMILAGSHKVDGNITGGNILTNGTANVGTLIATLDGTFKGKVDINGNTTLYSNGDVTGKTFTATLFSGNGASITNLKGVNIDSLDATTKLNNLATAISAMTVATATSSGSITTVNGLPQGSYSNITGVGTLGSLTVSGTVLGGNIGNSATKFTGNGASITNVTAVNVPASGITGQTGMWESTNRPGATRLYRKDVDDGYNLQVDWVRGTDDSPTGPTHWRIRGYDFTNNYHAPAKVAYADSAASAATAGSATSAGSATTATTATYVTNLTSANVTGALGYTPISSQYSPPQGIGTGDTPQFKQLGIGTPASGTDGEIRATNNITAYYSSDIKFKENVRPISDALEKVKVIGGKFFEWTDEYIKNHGGEDGYFIQKKDFGVIAQDVLKVFPEAVRTRPDGSLAVDYEKLSALAFQAIVEQEEQHAKDIQLLQDQINTIMNLLKDKK